MCHVVYVSVNQSGDDEDGTQSQLVSQSVAEAERAAEAEAFETHQ